MTKVRDENFRGGAADEPLALRQSLRNPAIPQEHLCVISEPLSGVDVAGLRKEYRKSLSDDRAKRRKAIFLEKTRNSPEDLFDSLSASKARVDLNTPIADIAAAHRKRLLTYTKDFGGIHIPSPPVPGQGEMWWGETWFTVPNRIGMYGMFNDQGLLLFGTLSWDDGDLLHAWYRVYSSFYLSPDRMPAASHVRSSPGGVLAGQMFGYTGGGAPFLFGGFAEGDQWSKCYLRLHQRAYAIHPNNAADIIPAAPPATHQIVIFDLDDDSEFAEGHLPGGLPYPSIDIHLIKERILRIDLEIELYFQLEGEAGVRFGGIGHSNPALHQWSQWKLQPL